MNRFMMSLATLALLINGYGAGAQTQFQKTTGSANDDLGYQIATLPSGNLMATGSTNAVSGNLSDSYLIKFNRFGEVKWALTFGGTGDETSWDLVVTQSNQVVGVGTSNSLGTPAGASTISKTDTSGTILWLTGVYSLTSAVDFYRVMETSTGHLLATGLVGTNQDDILLCKFSSTGSLVWSKSVGTAQADEAMGITETAQGDYLLAGVTNDLNGNGQSDFGVVKMDANGNVKWKKNYGGSGSDRLNSVIEINNAYYFCGWSSSVGQGSSDVVVMKTDTAGNIIWAKAFGTVQNDRAFNMLYNSGDSAIILSGYTDYSVPAINRNTILMSIDLLGNLNWAKSYGSSQTDGHWPTGLARNNDLGYYLLGISNSFSTGSDDDLYLVKTDEQGNTTCNQKNPSFVSTTITGWAGTNFGTAASAALTSTTATIAGANWTISSTSQCCRLYADAGPDTTGCPDDTLELGGANMPGYSYEWKLNGNPVSSMGAFKVPFSNSGTYTLSVTAPGSGCGAMADTAVVSAHPRPPKPTVSLSGAVLTSSSATSYQWYENGSAISGANQQSYTALASASYYVVVTNPLGCTAMSDTLRVTIGLEDLKVLPGIIIYPNPTKGLLQLQFGQSLHNVLIRLHDVTGRQVYSSHIERVEEAQKEILNFEFLVEGIYQLTISSAAGGFHRRIVIYR